MTVRMGVNPIVWTNDDLPELGDDTPLDQCLAEAKEAGYAGVELGRKFPRDPDALGGVLAVHGLSLVSGWWSGRLLERSVDDELRAMEPHLALLSGLGAKVAIFAEVTGAIHGDRGRRLSTRPVLAPELWAPFGAKLTALAERTAARGLQLVYHHHMGTVVQTEDEVARLLDATGPAVELLLDTGHLAYAGADPVRAAARFGARVGHVHLKDVRPRVLDRVRAEDRSFLDAVLEGVYTVPGDGAIDWDGVLAQLQRAGYAGWLVVEAEQDPSVASPLTYAKMGYENAVSAAVGAGLYTQPWCC